MKNQSAQARSAKNQLPNDPKAALLIISQYIKSVKLNETNRTPNGADQHNFDGYDLPIDWIYGLLELGEESERIANLQS